MKHGHATRPTPRGGNPAAAKVAGVEFLVGEHDILVLTYLVDENYPWGGPFDPITQVWRLPTSAKVTNNPGQEG